jgi:hypothetical protein
MPSFKLHPIQIAFGGLLGVSVVFAALVFIAFFQQIPIESGAMAIDWKKIWPTLEGGNVRYGAGLLMNPPWSALLVSPLGWLSLRSSWGLLSFLTVAVLVVSVPRVRPKRFYWLSILLLVTAFPTLRHMIDGNFEVLIVSGALLIVQAYPRRQPLVLASGMLLIVSKPQSGMVMLGVLFLYALQDTAQRSFWLKTAGYALLIAVPCLLWKGNEWLQAMLNIPERSSIMDVSLMAALNRPGWIPAPLSWAIWLALLAATFVIAWRTRPALSREKAGILIAASLFLAPYASGNSLMTVLAVGVIPLFQKRPLLGLPLIVMIDALFFWNRDMLFYGQAYFQTATLVSIWAVLAWWVWKRRDIEPVSPSP